MPEPSVPAVVTEVRGTVASISHYFKAHEVLISIVGAFILLWCITGKVQDVIAAHDQKNLTLAQQTLQAQVDKNTALATQVQAEANERKAQAAQYEALAAQTTQLNASLQQANAALVSALAKQQATDKTLPPTALAQRIEQLAALPPQSVQPRPDNSFKVGQPAAVAIAVTLEQVPALQGQLKNTQDEKANTDKQLAASQGLVNEGQKQVTTLNSRVDGLNLQLGDAEKVCDGRIKVVKDAAAKSKRKWFVAGFLAGLATRLYFKF